MVEFRVRVHTGELARIEVPLDQLETFLEPTRRMALNERFQQLGFNYVTLDLAGFRSGSLNSAVTGSPSTVPLSPRRGQLS